MYRKIKSTLAGFAAGAVNGLFGAGGGMLLVPLLSASNDFTETEVFSSSIVIILPICLVSLAINGRDGLYLYDALPYLIGSIPGGLVAGFWGHKIPVKWLHRFLGLLILYGGVRYLC